MLKSTLIKIFCIFETKFGYIFNHVSGTIFDIIDNNYSKAFVCSTYSVNNAEVNQIEGKTHRYV